MPELPDDDFDDLLAVLDRITVNPAQPARHEQALLTQALRELNDEPLIRHHRRLDEGWSWLCPDQHCQRWTAGYQTLPACRVAWFRHCTDVDHGLWFMPSWPADQPCDVFQPTSRPGHDGSIVHVLLGLIRDGRAVDRMGWPLQFGDCVPCAGTDPNNHQEINGRTCVRQVLCPRCGAAPGAGCDRSTPALAVVDYGQHQRMPSGHPERFAAAAAADVARAEAGDMTVAAPWLPDPVPSRRPARRSPAVMWNATIAVRARSDSNDLWKGMVYEYQALGRLWWTDRGEVANLVFETAALAGTIANILVGVYGIAADRVQVLRSVDPARMPGLARRVTADAENVLDGCTADTPDEHVAWALGAYQVRSVEPAQSGRLDAGMLRTRFHTAGGSGGRTQYSNDGGVVHIQGRRVSWTAIAAVAGDLGPDLTAEVGLALDELAAFPRQTVEHDQAAAWGRELAAQMWQRCRPPGLAPFTGRAAVELTATP